MRRKKLVSAFAFTAVLTVMGCAGGDEQGGKKNATADFSAAEAVETSQQGNMSLLFFLNPYGQPCKTQDTILIGMGEKLTGSANLQYIKTTDPDARAKFSEYGIRALPSLILLDADGDPIKRFPPGIQSETTILDAMGSETE